MSRLKLLVTAHLLLFISYSAFAQCSYLQFSSGINYSFNDLNSSIPGISNSLSWGYGFENGLNFETGIGMDYLIFPKDADSQNSVLFPLEMLLGFSFQISKNASLRLQSGGSVFYLKSGLKNNNTLSSSLDYSLLEKLNLIFQISDHWDLLQSFKYSYTFSDRLEAIKSGSTDSYFALSVGFSYRFSPTKLSETENSLSKDNWYEEPQKKDSDLDGIPDYKDDCPDIPGIKQNHGCPEQDSDKDGIPDSEDNCPNEPEIYNGFQDEDGCPDSVISEIEKPKTPDKIESEITTKIETINPVVISPEKKISESVRVEKLHYLKLIFPKNSATLKREQVEPLSEFAKKNKSAKKIELSVFCWETSNPQDDQKMADKRAENIRKLLIQMGISSSHLTVHSTGKKPLKSDSSGQQYEVKIDP